MLLSPAQCSLASAHCWRTAPVSAENVLDSKPAPPRGTGILLKTAHHHPIAIGGHTEGKIAIRHIPFIVRWQEQGFATLALGKLVVGAIVTAATILKSPVGVKHGCRLVFR